LTALNRTSQEKSTCLYEYDIQMMASQYLLQNAMYMFLGDDNTLKEPEFSYFGTAEMFMDLLIKNVNRTGYTFFKGALFKLNIKTLLSHL
jgi:hypothetical protein